MTLCAEVTETHGSLLFFLFVPGYKFISALKVNVWTWGVKGNWLTCGVTPRGGLLLSGLLFIYFIFLVLFGLSNKTLVEEHDLCLNKLHFKFWSFPTSPSPKKINTKVVFITSRSNLIFMVFHERGWKEV